MKIRPTAIVAVLAISAGLALAPSVAVAAPADCRALPVDADPVLKSDLARTDFGVDGTGVKVGVISDSYNVNPALSTAAENVAQGLLPGAGNPCGYATEAHLVRELPPPTAEFPKPGTDEGRAMMQLVHGIAPGAELYFASAGPGFTDVEGAIGLLVAEGVDIIVDDVISDSEPFYQESTESVAVANAVAAGITYLSAAGNNTALAQAPLVSEGQEVTPIGAWETTAYRPAPCDPSIQVTIPAGFTGYDCLDFDPGTDTHTISNMVILPIELMTALGQTSVELTTVMQWGEPYGSSRAAFDMVVTTGTSAPYTIGRPAPGYPIAVDQLPIDITGKNDPTDAVADEMSMQISIVRYTSGSPETDITPPIGYLFAADGAQWAVNADYWRSQGPDTVGRTIVGHNGAPEAITIAATGAFADDRVENFSSLGPVTYYFTPETDGGPFSPLPEPREIAKPNFLSVDGARQNVITGGATSSPDVYYFYGTSAATPTAGAVAALALQLNPQLAPADIRALLTRTATPIASPYATIPAEASVGAGLINAQALLYEVDATLPARSRRPGRPARARGERRHGCGIRAAARSRSAPARPGAGGRATTGVARGLTTRSRSSGMPHPGAPRTRRHNGPVTSPASAEHTHRTAVVVSGGDAVSPFTTPDRACGRGLAAGNTDTALRARLLEAGIPVFTAPAMNGRGPVQDPPADSFGAFGDAPQALPAHMTIVSNGDIDNAGEHLARFVAFLHSEYGVGEIDWIGHSNGGLFALAASRILREIGSDVAVRSLTTLGTPWEGGVLNRIALGEVADTEMRGSAEMTTLMAGFRDELTTELGLAGQDTHRYLLGDNGWLEAQRGVLDGVPMLLVGGCGLAAPNAAGAAPDPTIWPHDGFVSESSALARSVPAGVLGEVTRRSYALVHSIFVAEVLGRPWNDGLTWNTEVLDDVAAFIEAARS